MSHKTLTIIDKAILKGYYNVLDSTLEKIERYDELDIDMIKNVLHSIIKLILYLLRKDGELI